MKKTSRLTSFLLAIVMVVTTFIGVFPPLKVNAATEKTYVKRYTVLVLDTSGMVTFTSGEKVLHEADPALDNVKKASKHFLNNIAAAEGDNYVAVISYQESATVVANFSKDMNKISQKIDDLTADNRSNISAGLEAANDLLKNIDDETAIKNIVLCTTGLTWSGDYSYEGKYDENVDGGNWTSSSTDVHIYAYANQALKTADTVKNNANLYVLGLFQTVRDDMPEEGMDVVRLFQQTAKDLASSKDHYHDIDDIDNIEFVFGELAETIISNIAGVFKYRPSKVIEGSTDAEAIFYYSDSYFRENASQYNDHLSTMSLCLELSAFPSLEAYNKDGAYDYSNQAKNAIQLLTDIGFKNIQTNDDFKMRPTTATMGVIVAQKTIKDNGKEYTLVSIVLRGGGYEAEWASNVTIGDSGNHQGFYEARDRALDFVKDYLGTYVAGDTKLWITGFSRGGAVAGLMGAWFNDHVSDAHDEEIFLDPEDIYTYTFEAPMSTLASNLVGKDYSNIHNIINTNDLVTKVAMSADKDNGWDFKRPGVDDMILPQYPDKWYGLNVMYMQEQLDILNDGKEKDEIIEYKVDDFADWELNWIEPNQYEFLNEFLNDFCHKLSRKEYVDEIQKPLSHLMFVVMGEGITASQRNIFVGGLISDFIAYINNPFRPAQTSVKHISKSIEENLKLAGIIDIWDNETADAVNKLLNVILNSEKHANADGSVSTYSPLLSDIIAIIASDVFSSHYPEICLAWLMSFDGYYNGSEQTDHQFVWSDDIVRIVHINCPVNVMVLNEDGQVVAEFIDDVLQNPDETDLYAYVRNGEKVIYLPTDSEYSIIITATGEGTMSYSVEEYSTLNGESLRSVAYLDIPLFEGKMFNATVPEAVNASTDSTPIAYSLTVDNEELTPDIDATLEEFDSANCNVEAQIEGEESGFITGLGEHLIGTRANLIAHPFECYTFEGWYLGNEKISDEMEYSFVVKNDISLTAKFTPNHKSNSDDGDCSTAITCSVCGRELMAAQKHLWNGVNDKYCHNDGCEVINPNYEEAETNSDTKNFIDSIADKIGVTSAQLLVIAGGSLAALVLLIIVIAAIKRKRR